MYYATCDNSSLSLESNSDTPCNDFSPCEKVIEIDYVEEFFQG